MLDLSYLLEGTNERVGFITEDGEVIEVMNICPEPDRGFEVGADDIMKYGLARNVVATWHTHPGASSRLSVEDYNAFRNLPRLKHYVIGTDGVSAYVVKQGAILNAPND